MLVEMRDDITAQSDMASYLTYLNDGYTPPMNDDVRTPSRNSSASVTDFYTAEKVGQDLEFGKAKVIA